jgi:hypothetical protein
MPDTEETAEAIIARQQRVIDYTDGLRALAAWLDEHPDGVPDNYGVTIVLYAWSAEELPEVIRRIGGGEKFADSTTIGVRRTFGPHVLKASAFRDNTCEAVPTGEVKTVTTKADPEAPLPEGARNIRTVTQVVYEVDEPVTEWVCPDSLLDQS